MPRDGALTKKEIMDSAEALVLHQGFAGTTVDSIIEQAGVTKGAFFHHFGSKQDLAEALIGRYVALDLGHLSDKMERAERLARDPLQQVLLFVGFFIEEADEVTRPAPGCLMGAYLYEAGMFDDRVLAAIRTNMGTWRERLVAKFSAISETHPPLLQVDYASLADHVTVVFEGAFIVSRSFKDPAVVGRQLVHYRNYLELLFASD